MIRLFVTQVQIVGYDARGPIPYYIVRNSWGSDFGIHGYLHVAMGKNLCGMYGLKRKFITPNSYYNFNYF